MLLIITYVLCIRILEINKILYNLNRFNNFLITHPAVYIRVYSV